MISCSKCTKDNQDHYKFCLGCGAELPRDAAPRPFAPPKTPAQGVKQVAAAPAYVAPPHVEPAPAYAPPAAYVAPPPAPSYAPPAAPAQVAQDYPAPAATDPSPGCPQCGSPNAASNTFCLTCGTRLTVAPQPPVAAAQPIAYAPPVVFEPPPPAAPLLSAVVLTALRADGTEAGTYALPNAPETAVGRDTGSIFAGDSYLSPRHAVFTLSAGGGLSIRDAGSLNGVYKRVPRDIPVELAPGDVFRIGQEIIRYESIAPLAGSADGVERLGAPSEAYVGRIALVIGRDSTGNAFPVPATGLHIGRERGDVLFPEDGYVSGLHCHLSWNGGRLFLTDLGSSNGTFQRIGGETSLASGDVLLMGQQLFRVAM